MRVEKVIAINTVCHFLGHPVYAFIAIGTDSTGQQEKRPGRPIINVAESRKVLVAVLFDLIQMISADENGHDSLVCRVANKSATIWQLRRRRGSSMAGKRV